ncbi:hypothetical protein F5144DRAFT_184099 [Chaetomium tenue]|uniref:Uncharacterized protein n=1 Tax=Chaetomium tenue TaxID=1854479 RepID=A0ACB7PBJ1_9PEZI|nr:hypothetical protein F5144DRAFT_184099 [Chaetomium globosum]
MHEKRATGSWGLSVSVCVCVRDSTHGCPSVPAQTQPAIPWTQNSRAIPEQRACSDCMQLGVWGTCMRRNLQARQKPPYRGLSLRPTQPYPQGPKGGPRTKSGCFPLREIEKLRNWEIPRVPCLLKFDHRIESMAMTVTQGKMKESAETL